MRSDGVDASHMPTLNPFTVSCRLPPNALVLDMLWYIPRTDQTLTLQTQLRVAQRIADLLSGRSFTEYLVCAETNLQEKQALQFLRHVLRGCLAFNTWIC